MARPEFKSFYNSAAWIKLSNVVRTQSYHLCQLCQQPGDEIHHIIPITLDNLDNPRITLNPDNLICLCHDCHNAIHDRYRTATRKITFDSDGRPTSVQEPQEQSLNPEQRALYEQYRSRAYRSAGLPPPRPERRG